ncbi:hypothetical protein Q9L58_008179 [Maublancomyces gigas]|uniref:Fumarylacetoacetase-like C-terminal domain-containing protein n=1 Tax=Discina gigas TaxID=1032678 RepID=A0ABR3GAZ3_9PEZI
MSTIRTFSRLIRFTTADGMAHYGDAILPSGVTDVSKATKANLIVGNIFASYRVTEKILDVRTLLAPLALSEVKTVRCLGLNYAQHAKETQDPIPVHAITQAEPGLDYECELVVIIGKKARDVPEDKALDYVLGYSVGNDVSHRDWQLKKGGGQW